MAKKKKSFRGRIGRNSEKKRAEKKGLNYLKLPKGVELFKPEKGSIKFDIMPYVVTDEHHLDRDDENGDAVVGDIWWKKPFKVHKNVGINGDTVVCPKTFGKPCPICEEAKKLNDAGEEWDDIKEIFAKDRSLYVIIPIDASKFEEEYKEKPYVFDMSYHLFEKQLDEELGVDEENEVFPNLEGGKTLDVRFRQKKFGKAVYHETAVIKFEDRDADYEDGYEEEIPNLDEMLVVYSYAQLKSMFFEQADPEEEENEEFEEVEEEDEEKPKRKKKTTHKAVRDEEEEEEEEDDEPVRKKKPARKPVAEEEEEEEDEPVKKKASRTKKPAPKTSKTKCPHGHTFGKDGNDMDECSDCDLWDDCMDEKEKEE